MPFWGTHEGLMGELEGQWGLQCHIRCSQTLQGPSLCRPQEVTEAAKPHFFTYTKSGFCCQAHGF